MSVQHTLLSLWVIPLLLKVVLMRCEVVLVNRNVIDSFRVGKDGCSNNTNICTISGECQVDSGLCLCLNGLPDFQLNPSSMMIGKKLYGCRSSADIQAGAGGISKCLNFRNSATKLIQLFEFFTTFLSLISLFKYRWVPLLHIWSYSTHPIQ